MKITAVLFFVLLLFCLPAFGEEGTDFDSLFEEDMIEEDAAEPSSEGEAAEYQVPASEATASEATEFESLQSPEKAFLISEFLEWGGRFDSSFSSDWSWLEGGLFLEPEATAFNTRLGADLFFDARPDESFRVFGKIKAAYDPVKAPEDWDLSIFELFSDFNIKDRIFFRVGKQTIRWGVGYFFSPADVFSLVLIDPEDPGAEREGPVSLKGQLPFGVHNLYLYLLAPPISEDEIPQADEIAVAPKLELVLWNYELGLGGFYQKDRSPRAMLTLTGPIWDIDFFGEAVLSYGSERTFVRDDPLPYKTYRKEDELFFSGTAGLSYMNPDWHLSLFGQYFYNGEGYQDSSLLATAGLAVTSGDLSPANLIYFGRHYLSLSLGWSDIGESGVGLSVLWLANLSDSSGYLLSGISWQLFDFINLSTSLRLNYGDQDSGAEYAPMGPGLAWSIGLNLGSGRF